VFSLRYFGRPIHHDEPGSQIECYGADHSRLHLILLRAMASITLAIRMAWWRGILTRLHGAARKTSRVGEHQCDREQDQNVARNSSHFLSA